MNILFITQTKSLEVFYEVLKRMKQQTPLDRVGFYVAGGHFFDEFQKKNPEIGHDFEILKEWVIFQKAKDGDKQDLNRLNNYEEKYGDPFLWSAAIADRRIFLGKKSAITQDYRCRHSHEEIQSILCVTIEEMEGLFDRVKPDLVVSFICVTAGEYIASLIANNRKIPLINLRTARVQNYFYEGDTSHEPPTFLEEEYQRYLQDPTSRNRPSWQEAKTIIHDIRHSHLKMYEGAPALNWSQTGRIQRRSKKLSMTGRLFKLPFKRMEEYLKYRWGSFKEDPQYLGLLFPLWYHRIVKPFRIRLVKQWFKKNARFGSEQDLSSLDYVYFPLHKEPEVSLLVYGSFCLNQIEIIRQIARSLPIGMKLVVKDHPAGPGYHPLSFYKKIAEIPNVVLVPASFSNRTLIRFSQLVTIISGSTGLEALMLGKPVIILAEAPFQFLPSNMVRSVKALSCLPKEIKDLMANYTFHEEAVLAYLTAIIENSVKIDFYSLVLERAEHPRQESDEVQRELRQKNFEDLATYLLGRFQKRGSQKRKTQATLG